MLAKVWAIARNTFRECIRDKILYVILVFGLGLILASKGLGYMATAADVEFAADELKIMADLSLAGIWVFSLIIAIFSGTSLLYKEMDKRTLYTILSKPVERWQFLLGKYLGLLATIILMIAVMAAFFALYLSLVPQLAGNEYRSAYAAWVKRPRLWAALGAAILLTALEMAVVTAIALMFSSFSTPILSAVFTFVLVLVGHELRWMVELGRFLREETLQHLLYLAYLPLPHLHLFNARNQAVHAKLVTWEEVGLAAAYGLGYVLFLLSLSLLAFRRRNF